MAGQWVEDNIVKCLLWFGREGNSVMRRLITLSPFLSQHDYPSNFFCFLTHERGCLWMINRGSSSNSLGWNFDVNKFNLRSLDTLMCNVQHGMIQRSVFVISCFVISNDSMLDKAYLQFTSRYTHSWVFSYKPVPEGCTQDILYIVNGMLLYISFNEKKKILSNLILVILCIEEKSKNNVYLLRLTTV